MLLAGLAVFGVASLAGGLMASPGALIAARCGDGPRRGDGVPGDALADLQRLHRAAASGPGRSACGARSPASAIALGPIVGGWLLEHFGWRSIFFAMAPVAALAGVLVARLRPDLAGPARAAHRPRRPRAVDRGDGAAGLHDHRGAGLRLGQRADARPASRWRRCCSAAFIAWERRAEQPMLDVTPVPQPALQRRQRRGHGRRSSRCSASSS